MATVTIQQAFELAVQHQQAERLPEAEAICRQILTHEPRHAATLHLLGIIASQTGDNQTARDLIGQALQVQPDNTVAHFNLGNVLQGMGNYAEAAAAYQKAIALQPSFAAAHNNLGAALKAQARPDEAVAAYRLAIQHRPDYAEAYSNLGVVLNEQGRTDEAIAACRDALKFHPDSAAARYNLANAMRDQGRIEDAIAGYGHAIRLMPDDERAHINLGNLFEKLGRYDEAIAAYRRGIQATPNLAPLHNNLGNAFRDQGQINEAMESYRRATALSPENAGLHSNLIYATHFHPGYDAHALKEENARWVRQHGEPLAGCIPVHDNRPDSERRLKVGYVSADFRHNMVSHFLTPLLEAHNHAEFEICCYASVHKPDAMTARMRATADVWKDVCGLRDEALAEMIREDRIDILVDLSQHTTGNRLLVFARKPSPVQVAWLGDPGSTGLRTIDYRLTDAGMDPEGAEWSESVEKVVRLRDCWFCFDPIDEYPLPGELPALRKGHVTFGCLNDFAKINDAVLRRWAAVLSAVERSKLLLRCPGGAAQARVRQLFERAGIAADRVELVPRTATRAEFCDLFQRIDIALDPFPYNGGTSTCEALWMGIPVLTLPGEMTVSRLGLSILTAAGMPEFVANSEADYVRLAASLAADLPRLAHLRATFRERMRSSPFMDAPRFARNVEAAYREMWRAWCAQQPAPFQHPPTAKIARK